MYGETFLKQLCAKRNIVLLGEAGSGKSEIALNIAKLLKASDNAVDFFDLDQTKPLFRSRDVEGKLADMNINFRFEEQLLDTPTIVGGVLTSLADAKRFTVIDIGGGELGSRMIGRFHRQLCSDESTAIYIINSYRPWARSIPSIMNTMDSVLFASRLQNIHIVANPNLGEMTTDIEFIEGFKKTKKLLPEGYLIEGACVRNAIYDKVRDYVDVPLLPLEMNLTYEWAL